MSKLAKGFTFAAALFSISSAFAAAASPIGYWKTIDDVTGKPKSVLQIYQSGHAIYGKVVKIYPRPGFDQNEVCSACTGTKHNQRIVGMEVMKKLVQDKQSPTIWSGGSIMDPLNGKTYHCMLTVSNDGNSMNVRGYIGIALFGRTQTWVRVGDQNG